MKKIFAGTLHTKFIAVGLTVIWTIAMANSEAAVQLQEARVTQVVNDVKLLLEQAAPRPATVSDLVGHGTAVRTGTQSRSELTFADLTITRLGANTIFSYKEGTREMNLVNGAILFQVPKGSGGATIRTVGVTAAITGTTGIAEFHPATTSHPQPTSKWLCLEGTFHLYLPNGQSVEVGPGKMVATEGKSFSKVRTFDIAKLVKTSLFFTGFDKTLASMNLIMLESQNQVAGLLATTTNPLDPARIVNVTSQAIVAEETPAPAASPTPPITPTPPPPSPTPSKFGTPSVISSPDPYLITTGTIITTDPSITTNGVTDYGKIYRGQTDDGAFSLWAFGATSAFDTALRIDNVFFADPGHLPIAVFKFQSLSLTGNPVIDTTNGVTKLALIGVDGITSRPPGGTLTFTGLDLLLLATVNGSINLTSDVSFEDLHELVMYARGAGSDLTINSPISNIEILGLVAQDSLHLTNPGTMSIGKLDVATGSDLTLQIGGSLLLDGRVRLDAIVLPGASVTNGVNLTLNIAGDFTNNSATELSHLAITNRDHIGGDAIIAVGAGSISTGNNLDVQIANAADGHIGENALVNVGVSSGDISIGGDASFQILNAGGGHIGDNADILVTTGKGGDLIANSIFAFINNRNGGSIGSSAGVAFDIGGALTTQGDATFQIFNSGAGTIGSDATMNVSANTISTTGALDATINNTGGSVGGNAIINLNAPGTINTAAAFNLLLANYDETGNPAGHIHAGANVSVSTGGDFTADFASIVINNRAGGMIDSSATLTVNIGGALTTLHNGPDFFGNEESLSLTVSNRYVNNAAGFIGGDATLLFHADSASIGGNLAVLISDRGGTVDGNALLNFNVTHDLNVQGDADWQILNDSGTTMNAASPIGGTIHGSATLLLSATNLSVPAGSLDVSIYNKNGGVVGSGGTIDSDANITFTLTGNLATQGDASFGILNHLQSGGTGGTPSTTGGTIGGNATVNLSAANLTADSLFVIINNRNDGVVGNGGVIDSNATINFNTGNLITHTGATFFILNSLLAGGTTGGTIGADATINVTAASISPVVDSDASSLLVTIGNNGGGSIGGDAVINVNAANITANSLLTQIDNTGGSIGANTEGGATINMNVSNSATVTNDATVAIYGSDGAVGGAGININDGNYNVGGTFLSYIDGNGTITFNNASAHGDVLKAGVFGNNGTLTIGGGTLSADSTLKLYAPGSNGQLNFISNVTLGGNSLKILAANSITIFNKVVVTIGGSKPADVYTGFTGEIPNANYTGFGGNGSTTGTFAGAGANDPQPIAKAPPFGTTNRVTSSTKAGGGGRATRTTINVSSSDQLLAMLDDVHPGRDGQIRILDSKKASHGRSASRLNAAAYLNAHRREMDKRTASTPATTRLPQ